LAGFIIAVSPCLLTINRHLAGLGRLLAGSRAKSVRFSLMVGGVIVIGLAWMASYGPIFSAKLIDYLINQSYFPTSVLLSEVGRIQLSLVTAVLIGCWVRRINLCALWRCSLSRVMMFFGVLLLLVQLSVANQWAPELTSRFQDTFGYYLLILVLAWLVRYRVGCLCLLPLLVTVDYWLYDQIILSGLLNCGANDQFLCIPDRWPWQVTYWQ
jgi:hypothetical protein